jgi:hypothetical protein
MNETTLSILRPGDAGYDEARRVHNGLIDRRPALIARCLTTTDVVSAVILGRSQGLRSRSEEAATTWRAGPSPRAA